MAGVSVFDDHEGGADNLGYPVKDAETKKQVEEVLKSSKCKTVEAKYMDKEWKLSCCDCEQIKCSRDFVNIDYGGNSQNVLVISAVLVANLPPSRIGVSFCTLAAILRDVWGF